MPAGLVAYATLFAFSFLLRITVLSAEPPASGFTLSLIPRDSLNSPNDDSRFAHIQSAINRSIARANLITTFRHRLNVASDLKTDVIAASGSGEYIMNVSFGTPPFSILAIADTGSDLIWTQCKPCSKCYKQKATLFDPTKSSTYKPVPCSAPECTSEAADFDPSCSCSNKCRYSHIYADESTTNGLIATETLTLGPSKFPKILFGCGFHNQGTYTEAASGIIGLGIGPDSLISQMGKTIGGKFSYCLVPHSSKGSKSSAINFGKNAVVSGEGVVSTPLVKRKLFNFYYSLTIEAITVGTVRIPFPDPGYPGEDNKGNTIIDSGTPLLILPVDLCHKVVDEITKQVRAKRVERHEEPYFCYESASFKAPDIVVNFDGADVKLNDFNAFMEVEDGLICFAAFPTPNYVAIYGSFAQMNFLVGYDKVKKIVSFKHADCSSYSK